MSIEESYGLERAVDATTAYMIEDDEFVESVNSRFKAYTTTSVRLTVHVDQEDFDFIENWSKRLGLSRSAFASFAIKELDSIWRREWWERYCEQHPEVLVAIKKVRSEGSSNEG